MEGMTFIEESPVKVDFYFENTKIVTVENANVFFHPASADVMPLWQPKQVEALGTYIAPHIAKMLK